MSHAGRRNSWFWQLFSRGPVGLQSRASRTHVTPWNGWLCLSMDWSIDHVRRCSAVAAQVHAKFLLSTPRCSGFVTPCSQLKFVAVVGPGSESFATRVRRLFQLVLLALGRRNRKPKSCRTWRSTVGGSFVFLPSAHKNCVQFALKTILLLAPSLPVASWCNGHPGFHANWPDMRATEHSPPFNDREQVVEIFMWGTYPVWDGWFGYLHASPGGSQDTLLQSTLLRFFEKALKVEKKSFRKCFQHACPDTCGEAVSTVFPQRSTPFDRGMRGTAGKLVAHPFDRWCSIVHTKRWGWKTPARKALPPTIFSWSSKTLNSARLAARARPGHILQDAARLKSILFQLSSPSDFGLVCAQRVHFSVVFCVNWKGLRLKFTNEPSVL